MPRAIVFTIFIAMVAVSTVGGFIISARLLGWF